MGRLQAWPNGCRRSVRAAESRMQVEESSTDPDADCAVPTVDEPIRGDYLALSGSRHLSANPCGTLLQEGCHHVQAPRFGPSARVLRGDRGRVRDAEPGAGPRVRPPVEPGPDSPTPEDERERRAMERFLSLLEKNPRRGTALDRVYGYHVERGTLDELHQVVRGPPREGRRTTAPPG